MFRRIKKMAKMVFVGLSLFAAEKVAKKVAKKAVKKVAKKVIRRL